MTFSINDLSMLHHEQRVAVIAIDLQQIFQIYEGTSSSKLLRYQEYNDKCWQALNEFRRLNLPIIHVAYDINDSNVVPKMTAEEDQLFQQTLSRYRYNNQTMCVDSRNGNTLLKTDLLHDIQDGEMVYLKPTISAFNKDQILDNHLKSKKIDTVIFIGMYTPYCMQESMEDGHSLGYNIIGLADLMESQTPEYDHISRTRNNKIFFKAIAPHLLIEESQNVINFLEQSLTNPAPQSKQAAIKLTPNG